jgi:acetyl esterase/lipase
VAALGPPPPSVTESYLPIPVPQGQRDGRIKVFRPATPPPNGSPLIVLLHGGGFCFGSLEEMTAYGRSFVSLFGAVVVSITYRLAPEHVFPAGHKDGWETLKWIAAHATELGAVPSRGFIIGGVSAGASISSVLACMAKEEGLSPPLTGQWLSVPLVLAEEIVPEKYREVYLAREQNANAPMGPDKRAADILRAAWKPDIYSPLFSPFNWDSRLEGLPPAYFQVCGGDRLRDDSLIYERELRDQGVKTRIDIYRGLPHAFWEILPGLKASKKARVDVGKGIAWLLGTNVGEEELERTMQLSTVDDFRYVEH